MFELTQNYLHAHWDAETGETSGNPLLMKFCMKLRYAYVLNGFSRPTVRQIARAMFMKATF